MPPRANERGAAVIGKRLGADTVVAAMPADHHIAPAAGFRATIGDAIGLAAASGAIVVVGITPTRAESGFGYQKIGQAVGAGFKVDRFIEKPSPARARQMVRSGNFLWNAGMFVMRIDRLEAQLEAHAPALAAAMRRLGETSRRPNRRTSRRADLARIYRGLDFDSFDRVVAEKSRNVLGVRARFRWHDVGSWEGLWEAMRGDGRNVLSGNVVALAADGVLARGGKRLMVLLGVSDLIAVDTGDAVLIARRSESQEILLARLSFASAPPPALDGKPRMQRIRQTGPTQQAQRVRCLFPLFVFPNWSERGDRMETWTSV